MREPLFLRQNKDKWKEYEALLEGSAQDTDPDRLAELYLQLTDDIAYARTFYPNSKVVRYLNSLGVRTHLAVYRNKKEARSRLLTFWIDEMPLLMLRAHRYVLYAFLVFVFGLLLGVLSTVNRSTYFEGFFGEYYTRMTEENIRKGEPTGVYNREDPMPMFIRIAINNIAVSFRVFAAGLLFGFGALLGIPDLVSGVFQTGVMVGVFFANFWIKGQAHAIPIVWIHGTLELSAIVIAGGAGLMMGLKILFPGTHSRLHALQQGAADGVKIVFGLTPVFLVAAFLEGFVTRHSGMPPLMLWSIILLSAAFVLGYYIVYPLLYLHKSQSYANAQSGPFSKTRPR